MCQTRVIGSGRVMARVYGILGVLVFWDRSGIETESGEKTPMINEMEGSSLLFILVGEFLED